MTTTEDYGVVSREFASKSQPGTTYRVDARGTEAICNCPGYRTHRTCWHVKEVTRVAEQHKKENEERAVVPAEPVVEGDQGVSERRELVIRPPGPASPLVPTMPELRIMAAIAGSLEKARGSGLVPAGIKTPAAALAIMIAGNELGVPPMTALRRMYVVNGKAEPDTQLSMALVKGHDPTAQFIFHQTDAEACEVSLVRRGIRIITMKCTMGDARMAGLAGKGVWQKYPADMLRYYTLRRVLKMGAADLLNKIGVSVRPHDSVATLVEDLETDPNGIPFEEIEAAELFSEGDNPKAEPGSEPVMVEPKVEPAAQAKARNAGAAEKTAFWKAVYGLLEPRDRDDAMVYLSNALMLPYEKGGSWFTQKWIDPAVEMGLAVQQALDVAYLALEEVVAKEAGGMSLPRAAAEVDAMGRLKAALEGEGNESSVGAAQQEVGGEQAKEAAPLEEEAAADAPVDQGDGS